MSPRPSDDPACAPLTPVLRGWDNLYAVKGGRLWQYLRLGLRVISTVEKKEGRLVYMLSISACYGPAPRSAVNCALESFGATEGFKRKAGRQCVRFWRPTHD